MNIVCINNREITKDSNGEPRTKFLPITPGRIYNAEPAGFHDKSNTTVLFYYLMDNNEEMSIFKKENFVTQDAWREMQLIKLFDNN